MYTTHPNVYTYCVHTLLYTAFPLTYDVLPVIRTDRYSTHPLDIVHTLLICLTHLTFTHLQASIDTIATGMITNNNNGGGGGGGGGVSPVLHTSFGNWHNSFYTLVSSCLPQGCYTASLYMDPHSSIEGTQASIPACDNILLAPLHPHQVTLS